MTVIFILSFNAQALMSENHQLNTSTLTFVDSVYPFWVAFYFEIEDLERAIKDQSENIEHVYGMRVTHPNLEQKDVEFYNAFIFIVELSGWYQPETIHCFAQFTMGESLVLKDCKGIKYIQNQQIECAELPKDFPTTFEFIKGDLDLGSKWIKTVNQLRQQYQEQ